jgi:ubiquinone/menaquinone biosynthesis C-methylase UbiE
MTITVDIGGEGRHPGALNVNRSRSKTLGADRGALIPNLIVARADRLPLADSSVARVIVERTPLNREALAEIARVIAPSGTIELAHVPLPDADRHSHALATLPGSVERRLRLLNGQWVQETRFSVPASRCPL